MDIMHRRCAGLDVHKRTVVACVRVMDESGQARNEKRTFGAMTRELMEMSDWLASYEVTHVAMESTGVYWKPVYYILEGRFELLVVNAQHMKGVPGRKTDMQDAEWIAELLQYGLIRGSFVPPEAQRELRLLNRHRHNVITRRAQVINEIQKLLEDANIKLSNVVSDINGISATAILKELAVGHCDPEVLKELARGKLKQKKDLLREALTGRVCKQHRLILSQLLAEISHYDEQIEEMSKEIEERMIADQDKIDRLDDIPGVDRRVSETILSELGSDLSRFTDEHHAASWAGICPGNNESAGKRHSSRTRAGDKPLKSALIQAANAARHTRNTYLAAQYHRIAARRGHKRAIVAVAHSIFIIAYHIIHRGTRYQDLGADYFDRRNPDATIRRLVRRIKHLGYEVNLSPVEAVA